MALRVSKEREVLYPVTAKMLADDGSGKVVDVKFTVKYKPMSRKAYREKMRELNRTDAAGDDINMREVIRKLYDEAELAKYDTWLAEHVTGWGEDVTGEDGQPVPFSAENYALLMDIIPIASAIDNGLWSCSREEPAKN